MAHTRRSTHMVCTMPATLASVCSHKPHAGPRGQCVAGESVHSEAAAAAFGSKAPPRCGCCQSKKVARRVFKGSRRFSNEFVCAQHAVSMSVLEETSKTCKSTACVRPSHLQPGGWGSIPRIVTASNLFGANNARCRHQTK